MRMSVAHGANYRKTITCVWHVKVRKQRVKLLCRDVAERFANVRYGSDLKAVTFQSRL
jgi:hypothetical protein